MKKVFVRVDLAAVTVVTGAPPLLTVTTGVVVVVRTTVVVPVTVCVGAITVDVEVDAAAVLSMTVVVGSSGARFRRSMERICTIWSSLRTSRLANVEPPRRAMGVGCETSLPMLLPRMETDILSLMASGTSLLASGVCSGMAAKRQGPDVVTVLVATTLAT